jgi:hypothetical protein
MKKIITIIITLIISSNLFSKPYKGAELRTNMSFTYGRFEVRMKSANVSGMLTSFFTYHDNDPDYLNHWNEIDIENMGRYTNESQFNVISPGQVNHVNRQKVNFNPAKAFHVYAIEWTPGYISWSIDGYEVYRQYESHISTITLDQKIMMNIWQPTSVDWAGTFNVSDLPVYAYYDYVKYYKYTPGVNNNFTIDWVDNFDSYDTQRWTKATHTFDGNNVDFVTDNCVFKDGYMILCLTNSTNTGYNGGAIIDKDIDPPYLCSARYLGDQVKILFSEKITKESAEKTDNYVIGGAVIKNAKLLSDSCSVSLNVENYTPDGSNTLLALNLDDLAQPKNTLAYQQIKIQDILSLPIAIEIGGNAWNGYLKDQNWTNETNFGYEGGSILQKQGIQISKTNEPNVYLSAIDGIEFYKTRLQNGNYDLTLMFAELANNLPSMRIFDIYINGVLKISNFDISGETGINAALDKKLDNIEIKNNLLEIYFKAKTGKTILNGLKIIKNTTNKIKDLKGLNEKTLPELNIYPNPFNLTTTFSYFLKETGNISLKIYDLYGREISTLENGKKVSGEYNASWNAVNIPSGVYFCTLIADSKKITKKICLLK